MSIQTRYRACRLMFAFSFIAVAFSMSHLSPFDAAHSNLHWFIVLGISAIVGLGFGIGFYYYRAKLRENPIDRVGIEALANAGRPAKNIPPRKNNP